MKTTISQHQALKKRSGLWTYITTHEFATALLTALVVVAISLFLGRENNRVIAVDTRLALPGKSLLGFMSNWDGPAYLSIAQHGYSSAAATNYFPLYPLIIRGVAVVVRSPLYAGLLVSWAALVGAICFYMRIVKKLFTATASLEALQAALLFVLFPTGIFLLATYTESLFAMLSLGAIYYALQKRTVLSALLMAGATATHENGVFVLVLVALVLIEEGEELRRVLLGAIVGSLGALSYMVFLAIRFHHPLAFVTAQRAHGWLASGYLADLKATFRPSDLISLVFASGAAIYWWGRRKSFALYTFLYFCIPLVGGQFAGYNRYVLMDFPIPLMVYGLVRKRSFAYAVVLALFAVFWAYFTLQYAAGYIGS